jgi:hypothetical protein
MLSNGMVTANVPKHWGWKMSDAICLVTLSSEAELRLQVR